jgi:hypothetical protein
MSSLNDLPRDPNEVKGAIEILREVLAEAKKLQPSPDFSDPLASEKLNQLYYRVSAIANKFFPEGYVSDLINRTFRSPGRSSWEMLSNESRHQVWQSERDSLIDSIVIRMMDDLRLLSTAAPFVSELEKLAQLYSQGLLTQEEFQKAKAKLLG